MIVGKKHVGCVFNLGILKVAVVGDVKKLEKRCQISKEELVTRKSRRRKKILNEPSNRDFIALLVRVVWRNDRRRV